MVVQSQAEGLAPLLGALLQGASGEGGAGRRQGRPASQRSSSGLDLRGKRVALTSLQRGRVPKGSSGGRLAMACRWQARLPAHLSRVSRREAMRARASPGKSSKPGQGPPHSEPPSAMFRQGGSLWVVWRRVVRRRREHGYQEHGYQKSRLRHPYTSSTPGHRHPPLAALAVAQPDPTSPPCPAGSMPGLP